MYSGIQTPTFPFWNSNLEEDQRGQLLSNEITESTYAPLNDDTQTRVPFNALFFDAHFSSPDISLASQSPLLFSSWTPIKSLGSDHLPILIELPLESSIHFSTKKSFINFLRADWRQFTEEIESRCLTSRFPSSVTAGEKFFRDLVLRAARHHIPAGRHRHYTLSFSPESAFLAAEIDLGCHKNQPMEPTQHYHFTPSQLIFQLLNQTAKDKRNKRRKFLQTWDYRTGARKFWKMVRSLNGSRPVVGRRPIQLKTISSDTDIVKAFNKQFTNARIHGSDKLFRKTRRKIAKLTLLDNPTFSPLQTKQAIADSKPSRALGLDGLCNFHLNYLGP